MPRPFTAFAAIATFLLAEIAYALIAPLGLLSGSDSIFDTLSRATIWVGGGGVVLFGLLTLLGPPTPPAE